MNSHSHDDAVGSIHIVYVSQYVVCYCYGKTEQCDAGSSSRTIGDQGVDTEYKRNQSKHYQDLMISGHSKFLYINSYM